MKRIAVMMSMLMIAVVFTAISGYAWALEKEGVIASTELTFSELEITKKGVSVRISNTSGTTIRTSLRLSFFDSYGNSLGYTIFGLREISGDTFVNISENSLSGNWKQCRDAYRMVWSAMTYDLLY